MRVDLDVVLAAHGAGAGSPANAYVLSLAQRLEAAVGVRVTAAFKRGTMTYREALQRADRRTCLIVPLLTSDGFYAAELRGEARQWSAAEETIVLAPIGTDPGLVEAVARRVARAASERGFAPARTRVVVVGHGTARHGQSGDAARTLATAVGARTELAADAAYLDQFPSLEHVVAALPADVAIIVVPFLMGGGAHAAVDVPRRLLAAGRGDPTRLELLEPLGELAEVYDLIEQSVRDAAGTRRTLVAGARGSALSRRQVALAAERLAMVGLRVHAVPFETRGDRESTRPLNEFDVDDPFTREINDALRDGRVDVAVHSAKDLPLAPDPTIVDAAYLPRGAVEDVLVTRTGAGVSSLAAGARVGTSCARRAAQLRRLRRGLVAVPIRGDVPSRVAAVDRGDVDAVVLAAAGLERLGLDARIAERFDTNVVVPAPAQGAIVVQCRVDSPYLPLLRRIDHRATRTAVAAELAFARTVLHDGRIAAAHAVVAGGVITLRARLVDVDTAAAWDAMVRGRDPERLGVDAAAFLGATRALTGVRGEVP